MSGSSKEGSARDEREELAAVKAELETKIEELARANVELYETARRKSEFVANMSHELRTPLNSIIGFADVLLSQMKASAAEEQLRYLRNIRQGGYRLLELLSELLSFARLESGQTRVHAGPVSVPALIREVVHGLQTAQPRSLDYVIDVDDAMPTVLVDEIKLRQVLSNLGGNAVKFTADGGRITFTARLDTTTLTVCVADTGIGIAQKDRETIFQRFHQVDSGLTRRYDGVGLGLYIVDSLVRLMGGAVQVTSEVGKGSVFTITVPVEPMPL